MSVQSAPFRIGTRGSPLALAQAEETAARLSAALGRPRSDFTLVTFRTSGDRIQNRPLADAGGKGLFTKEIEEALRAGAIDLAVHSAKDMPTVLPEGLLIAGYLPREDVRDALISPRAASLADLPEGAVVGSSALRRKALLLRKRPDLRVIEFRGNVETRLRKLDDGQAEATLLALAGLRRLGIADRATAILDIDSMVPAVGQGAIALEIRAGDRQAIDAVDAVADLATGVALAAERAFLAALDGSCRTPIGGHARIEAGVLRFHGIIITPDGRTAHEAVREGAAEDAAALGRDAGTELAARAGPSFFA